MWGKEINGQTVGRKIHCFVEGLLDFVETIAAAVRKDNRFTSERHLRYFVEGQK